MDQDDQRYKNSSRFSKKSNGKNAKHIQQDDQDQKIRSSIDCKESYPSGKKVFSLQSPTSI